MSREQTLRIERRFRGPTESGNGGYVSGRLAAFIETPAVRVRLRLPPPLETPLRVHIEGGEAKLFHAAALVATAVPADPPPPPPPAPALPVAREAAGRCVGLTGHPYPECFVCGPARGRGDGLRIFAGPADGIVAAPFEPTPDLLDERGELRPEFVWSALDCPGFYAVLGDRMEEILLGEFTVRRLAAAPGKDPLVAYAWKVGQEGRKRFCGSALAASDGRVLAVGSATWITPKRPDAET